MDYLFVATYGRSGPTLLQASLNSIPGYRIRGENGGVVYNLYRFHADVCFWRHWTSSSAPHPPSSSWWGIDGYPAETALAGIRDLPT